MIKNNLHNTHKGYVAGLLSAIFFGCSGLFVKNAQNSGLDSISILVLQYIIMLPTLWSISFLKYRNYIKIDKKDLLKLFLIGMFLQSPVSRCYYESFKYLDISIATILLFTYPIIVTILSPILGKSKLNKIIILSVAIAFIGCILILDLFHTDASFPLKGVLLGLGGALFLALANMCLETFENRIPPFVLLSYTSTAIFFNFLIFSFPSNLLHESISSSQWINIALLALICQIPPSSLMLTAIQYIGAVKTAIIGNAEIPAAAILGYIFYGETLNLLQIVGIFFVIGGIILMQNSEYIQNKLTANTLKPSHQKHST